MAEYRLESAVDEIFVCPDCKKFHYEDDGSNVSYKLCFICGEEKGETIIVPVEKKGGMVAVVQACDGCARGNMGREESEIKALKELTKTLRKVIDENADAKEDGDGYVCEAYVRRMFESHHSEDETVVYCDFDADGVFKDLFK